MSVALDTMLAAPGQGTRFLIFPQPRFLKKFGKPEVVTINVPAGEVAAGPADERMFVVDAVNKQPYNELTGPPYTGEKRPPVEPGPGGHFDHLKPDTREFSAATMYATVRRVLDIWEDYFGHQIAWHFETHYPKLELIPLIEWNNAQSGYGFLEFGYGPRPGGGVDHSRPYCQNFDVLAHELGHSLIFAEVGVPASEDSLTPDYGGMHESAGDLVAIVSVLHFNSVVDFLLDQTKGNLFTVNELDRVGELSSSREIRTAFNYERMSDVGTEAHDRSLPLTGGIFDIFVEVFQKLLVSRGLITEQLALSSTHGPDASQDLAALGKEFAKAYKGKADGFKDALLDARDYLGRLLAATWRSLSPDHLTYNDVLRALLRADRDPNVSDGEHQQTIRECFAWREISLVPGSMLLRPHTLNECALNASTPNTLGGLADLDDEALELLLHTLNKELGSRGRSTRKGAARKSGTKAGGKSGGKSRK
jgi:hypothetical protein